MNTSRNEHDSLQPAALVNAVRKSCEFGFFRVCQPTAIALPDFVRQTIGKMNCEPTSRRRPGTTRLFCIQNPNWCKSRRDAYRPGDLLMHREGCEKLDDTPIGFEFPPVFVLGET